MMPEDYYDQYEEKIEELKVQIDLLLETLKFARDGLNSIPRSLAYDFTHVRKIDKVIEQIEGEQDNTP
jgi:hypothetical protein